MMQRIKQSVKNKVSKRRLQSVGSVVGGLFLMLGTALGVSSDETLTVIPAPTVLQPDFGAQILADEFLLAGVTLNNTEVDVYINDKLSGVAVVKNHPSGTASFAYAPRGLAEGEHLIWTQARSLDGSAVSSPSALGKYTIVAPFPGPTVSQPVVDADTVFQRPWIVGTSASSGRVEVELNGSVLGITEVTLDESGAGQFRIRPAADLLPGWHSVRARSIGAGGKLSHWSDSYVFEVRPNGTARLEAPQLALTSRIGDISEVAAPTLVAPSHGAVITKGELTIAGLVHNNHTVQLFADDKLLTEVTPPAHESGVTSFSYTLFDGEVPHGQHTVTARAVAADGTYSSYAEERAIIIKPRLAQLTVVSPRGVHLSPQARPTTPAPTDASIGTGVKVVRNEASGVGGPDEGVVVIQEGGKAPTEVARGEGVLPEIAGPVFTEGITTQDIDGLIAEVVASDTGADRQLVVNTGAAEGSVVVDGAGGESDKLAFAGTDTAQVAGTTVTASRVRPEALVLIIAGLIILFGILITFIRDQRLATSTTGVDFADTNDKVAFMPDSSDDGEEGEAVNPHATPPPPPPPAA